MSRIYGGDSVVADVERNELDWQLSKVYSEMARRLTDRDDVVVRVGRSTSMGAPGAWWRDEGVIELDGTLTELTSIPDLETDAGKAAIGPLHGVSLHEVSHANHTFREEGWHEGVDDKLLLMAQLLEEGRIEHAHVEDYPQDAMWLRRSAEMLLAGDVATPDPTRAALLLCARVDAGVLVDEDIEPVRNHLVSTMGQETYDKLREIWCASQRVTDGDVQGLFELGQQWLDVLKDAGIDAPESDEGDDGGESQSGTPGSSDGAGGSDGESSGTSDADSGDGQPEPGSLAEAIAKAVSAAQASAEADIAESVEIEEATAEAEKSLDESREAAANAASEAAKEAASAEREAAKVFKPSSGHGKQQDTVSVTSWREPDGKERAAAAHLARDIELNLYRPPMRTKRHTELPPGGLDTSGSIRMSAQLAAGHKPNAKPWKQNKRVPNPPLSLRVGLAVDRSGSMSGVISDACSAAYIVGAATQRVGGRFAAVTFGYDVEQMCRPGTYPTKVPVMRADAGTEAIGTGIDALTGALQLRDTRHVRLLVILSDAQWVDSYEDARGRKLISDLYRTGCHVVIAHSGSMKMIKFARHVNLRGGSVAETMAKEMLSALRK